MVVKKKTAPKTASKTAKKVAPKAKAKTVAVKAAPKAAKKVVAPKAKAKTTAAPKVARKVAAPKAKATRKANPAFMKALTPSASLADIVGVKPLPRTEVVSKIWVYIKKNNLQNPKNKRNILADEKLMKVFGKKEVTMFELAGIIGKHLS